MKSIAELEAIRKRAQDGVKLRSEKGGIRVVVGMATCGIAAGARPVMMALVEEVNKRELKNVVITQTGCIGACRLEPMVEVYQGEEKVTFTLNPPWQQERDPALPFWHFVTTERQINEDYRQLELSEGMEQTIIIPLVKQKLLAELGAEAIISEDKVLHVTFDNDKVEGTILFLVNDNIAIKRPITEETEAIE